MQQRENKFSSKRIINILACLVISMAGIFTLCRFNSALSDITLIFCLLSFLFLLLFLAAMSLARHHGNSQRQVTGFGYLTLRLLIAWGLVIVSCFLPDFCGLFLLTFFVLASGLSPLAALILTEYLNLAFCLLCGANSYLNYCYTILILAGSILTELFQENQNSSRIPAYCCIAALRFLTGIVFYYFAYLEISGQIILRTLIFALIETLAVVLLLRFAFHRAEISDQTAIDNLLSEDYPLLMELKRYSNALYTHAVRVSRLCGYVAKETGLNPEIASLGGLYYRIGKIYGEPEVDHAVASAVNHCFPDQAVSILREYSGAEKISTPESALVHMVDALVNKVELLDQDTMSSVWNQDMVIYQTLNELSEQGYYDEAGLSMNQFLKIRESLVALDSLY